MDFNHLDLLTRSSYLEQKINVEENRNKRDGSRLMNQVFLIPTFDVVGFPITNAEKTTYYYIELTVQKGYGMSSNSVPAKNNILKNVIFQYDVNYSDVQGARGSFSISTSVTYKKDKGQYNKNATLIDNNLPLLPGRIDNLNLNTYKIMIPTTAIKKDSLNVLNYNFTSAKPSNINDAFYVSDNNYGSLSFYFNQNPLYQLLIKPSVFTSDIFNLEINNPIVLKTDLSDFQSPILSCRLIGKPKFNEKFKITGNNLNNSNIVPIKISHIVEILDYSKIYELQKIIFFHNNFYLEQNTSLNILEENTKFYQDKKLDAMLVKDFDSIYIPNNYISEENYKLQYTSNIYNSVTNTISFNDEVSKNQFDLPLFDKFNFNVNIPLTFQTFFKYDVNIKFVENSDQPIIGNDYSQVTIQKLTKDNNEQWTQMQNITLSYEEILRFYSSDSFTYADYEHLNQGSDNHV